MGMLSTLVFMAVAVTGATEIRRGLEVDSDDGLHVRGARDVSCECQTPLEGTASKNGIDCSDDTTHYCGLDEECYAPKGQTFEKGKWDQGCRKPPDPAGTTASANDTAGGEESHEESHTSQQATCANHFFQNNRCPDQLPVEARGKPCTDEKRCNTIEFCCEKATCANHFFQDNRCPDQLPVEARGKPCTDKRRCNTLEFCCEKKTCRNQYFAQESRCPNRPNHPNGHYMKPALDKECTNDKDCARDDKGMNYCCVPAMKRLPCADFLKSLNGTCPDGLATVTKPGRMCKKQSVNDGVDCKDKCCKTAGAADPAEDASDTPAANDDEAAEGAGSPEAPAAANVGLM